MKKIIATTAALMIAGSAFATVASAAVEFSGDARARYEYLGLDTTDAGDDNSDFFSHRIRVKVKGTTAGGSYATMRFRVADTWNSSTIADTDSDTFTVDYAYVGVPLGCVELTAGRQPLNLTTGYLNDAGVDNLRLKYAQDATTLVGLYGVLDDDTTDTDKNDMFTAAWMQEWSADWSTTVAITYANFDNEAAVDSIGTVAVPATEILVDDGFMGVIAVAGQAGPVALAAEAGYQEEGISGSDDYYNSIYNVDDAFGIFASAGMDFDALGVTLVAGFSEEGYIFDAPVGFMLIGGDSQLTVSGFANVGALALTPADTIFAGLVTDYQATEELGLKLNLGYVNLDGDFVDADMFEVSAQAGYTINDGTVVYARAGYIDTDDAMNIDSAWAAGVSLELAF